MTTENKLKAEIKIARAEKEVRVVFPEDLGKGFKANQAAKQFEVDLAEFAGEGLTYRDGKLNAESPDLSKYDDFGDRLRDLEAKKDKFLTSVVPTRHGDMIQLVYTFSDGTFSAVDFEDKDTVTLAFDPSALIARLDALEANKANLEREIETLKQKPTIKSFKVDGYKARIVLTNGDELEVDLPRDTAPSAFGDSIDV